MIERLLRLVGRWARKPVNHTSWVAVVTPTDRPKSVRNRCLIELFCGVVCVVTLPFWHFCWCRGFCHRTESDLFLFLFFNTQSWQTLASSGHYCVPMHTNLFNMFCFSCQGKSRDVVYHRMCLFLWLIFAQHGLFEIHLTVYSALPRLTDLGIYYITRCGTWLLTRFYIPYIHFQRELRKVTSQKVYLSFLFSIDMGISSNMMKSPSPKCYMTFWDMTIYNDTLNWSDITPICELITELDLITDFDLIAKFWRFP